MTEATVLPVTKKSKPKKQSKRGEELTRQLDELISVETFPEASSEEVIEPIPEAVTELSPSVALPSSPTEAEMLMPTTELGVQPDPKAVTEPTPEVPVPKDIVLDPNSPTYSDDLTKALDQASEDTGDYTDKSEESDALTSELDALSDTMTLTKFFGIMNRPLPEIMDFPWDTFADMANYALTGTGLDKIVGQFQTGNTRKFFDKWGITVPEENIPDTTIATVAKWVGEALITTSLAPLMTSLKTGQSVKTLLPQIGQAIKTTLKEMGLTAVKTPTTFATKEIASTALAATGYEIAREQVDEESVLAPSAQMGGAIAGGSSLAIGWNAIKLFGGRLWKMIWQSGIKPVLPYAAEPRAAQRLKDVLEDPGKAKQTLADREKIEGFDKPIQPVKEDPHGYTDPRDIEIIEGEQQFLPEYYERLNPAQKLVAPPPAGKIASERPLLALERAVFESNEALKTDREQQFADVNQILIRALSEGTGGKIVLTREHLQQRQLWWDNLIQERLRLADIKAKERIAKLGPKIDPVAANKIVRQELDSAVADAVEQEAHYWAAVNLKNKVDTTPLKKLWRDFLIQKQRTADDGDFLFSGSKKSDTLFKELGRLDENGRLVGGIMADSEPIAVLQALRSRMLEELRGERAKLNSRNKLRIFGKLQSSILKIFEAEEMTIKMKKGDDGVWAAEEPDSSLLTALAFSRIKNDKFGKGSIRDILGSNPDGSFKVEPDLTLEKILNVTPTKRAVNVKKLFKAIERETLAKNRIGDETDPFNIAPVTEAVKSTLKNEFIDKFASNGTIAKERALQWLKDNRETLKQIPGLADEFKAAIKMDGVAQLRKSQNKRLLAHPKQAILIRVAERDPFKDFDDVLKNAPSDQSLPDIIYLVNSAKIDKTGRATEGLQQALFDWILSKSYVKGMGKESIDAYDNSFVSGFLMTQLLNKPSIKVMAKTILTKDQILRLELIRKSARHFDNIRKSGKSEKIMTDIGGWVFPMAGKILGGLFGRKLETGTLQAPAAGATRGEQMMAAITTDFGRKALIDAFTSKDVKLLETLLSKIDSPEAAKQVERQLNAYLAILMVEYNLQSPKEDFYGNIEEETTEQPQ
jgi:hypothetical protein